MPPRKISHYLLDLSHERGRGKAKAFIGFGFDPAVPSELETALLAHARPAQFEGERQTIGGVNISFVGPLQARREPWPIVRTIWFVAHASPDARFATAYVRSR